MSYQEEAHKFLLRVWPYGRAFKFPYMGYMWRLLRAFAQSIGRWFNSGNSVLDSIIPDNDNFDETDAANWERVLGIASSSGTSLSDRKAAIFRKLSHPGGQPARQHYLFLESQLRLAGFNVRVYENRFDDGMGGLETRTPGEILGITTALAIYGDYEYGEVSYGASWADDGISIIANYIDEYKDLYFDFGSDYRSTFYIAGETIDTFADVPLARKTEFRELILKLKAAQCVGFMFVNYI